MKLSTKLFWAAIAVCLVMCFYNLAKPHTPDSVIDSVLAKSTLPPGLLNPKTNVHDTDRAFVDCAVRETKNGHYSSHDGGDAASKLMTDKCLSEFWAWTKVCQNAGNTEEVCNTWVAVAAQESIKQFEPTPVQESSAVPQVQPPSHTVNFVPNATARGVSVVPGAIVCPSHDAVSLMFNQYAAHWEDTMQDAMTKGQSRLIRGQPAPAPDFESYGCALLPPGTPIMLETGNAVPVVTAKLPNGTIIRGVTFPDMVVQNQQQPESVNQQSQVQGYNPAADRTEAPQGPAPVPVEGEYSKPSANQPVVQQEPKPVPVENSNPPAQPPSIAQIDQQAIALWNQKRYSNAIPLFNQACVGRKMDACYYLGVMFEFGHGVAQDFSRARNLYVDACNAGNQTACNNLSILMNYEPNSLLCKSTSLAFTVNQYRDSCNAGNGTSCDTLGHLYSYGCGVAKDAEKTRQLYSKACTIGNQQGCDRLKEMQ
jgi:hypothetical protein